MSITAVLSLLSILAASSAEPPPAPAAPAPLPAGLDTLGFMAGHWVAEGTEGAFSEELWLPPRAGLMTGMNRAVSRKGRASFEFLRIEQRADGVVYVAQPGGAPPTEFRLTRAEASSAVFESPAHDFPKRIAYRREGETLTARVDDGTDGGKGFDLRWTLRVQ